MTYGTCLLNLEGTSSYNFDYAAAIPTAKPTVKSSGGPDGNADCKINVVLFKGPAEGLC